MPLLFSFGKEVFTIEAFAVGAGAGAAGADAVLSGMPDGGTGRFFPAGEHGICCGGDTGAHSHSCTCR